MNTVAKLILAAAALLLSGGLAAQTFKCRNADGKITYSGTTCSDLGLKDAGEVKDRLNVNPAYRPPAAEGRRPVSPPPGATPESRNTGAPAPAEEAASPGAAPPDRRCFSVSTAKGNVSRCNDRPIE